MNIYGNDYMQLFAMVIKVRNCLLCNLVIVFI